MNPERASQIVAEVFQLYERFGSTDYIGEDVTQIEHMCQSAQFAEAEGQEDEIILAAFFHDIGHLLENIHSTESMEGYGVVDHELIAGNYLRDLGFSERIARLVEMHVQTKRYLTFRYPDYFDNLSKASQKTLSMQGGRMNEEEAGHFENDELCRLHIKIREWDDSAKRTGQPVPELDKYRKMAFRHLLLQN